jgi:hypothetical protein
VVPLNHFTNRVIQPLFIFEKILSEVRCMRWRIGVSRVGIDVNCRIMGTGIAIAPMEGIVPDRLLFTWSRRIPRLLSSCFVRRSTSRLR